MRVCISAHPSLRLPKVAEHALEKVKATWHTALLGYCAFSDGAAGLNKIHIRDKLVIEAALLPTV